MFSADNSLHFFPQAYLSVLRPESPIRAVGYHTIQKGRSRYTCQERVLGILALLDAYTDIM